MRRANIIQPNVCSESSSERSEDCDVRCQMIAPIVVQRACRGGWGKPLLFTGMNSVTHRTTPDFAEPVQIVPPPPPPRARPEYRPSRSRLDVTLGCARSLPPPATDGIHCMMGILPSAWTLPEMTSLLHSGRIARAVSGGSLCVCVPPRIAEHPALQCTPPHRHRWEDTPLRGTLPPLGNRNTPQCPWQWMFHGFTARGVESRDP